MVCHLHTIYNHANETKDEEEDSIEPYMDLSLSEESSDESNNEEEDEEEDDTNWGKRKGMYYKYDEESDDDDEDSEDLDVDEEKEVIRIQKKKAAQRKVEDYDDTFDYISKEKRTKKTLESNEPSMLQSLRRKVSDSVTVSELKQLDALSKSQKVENLRKSSPELIALLEEFEIHWENIKALSAFIDNEGYTENQSSTYIRTKFHGLINLCTNISYYLLLKAQGKKSVDDHPVTTHLETVRDMMNGLRPIDEAFNEFLEDHMAALNGEDVPTKKVHFEDSDEQIEGDVVFDDDSMSDDSMDSAERFYKQIEDKTVTKKRKRAEEKDQLENFYEYRKERETTGKRKVNREIEKNIGLRRRRKKVDRNPRVKNKQKYNKAVKRRKGQVLSMRDQSKPYSGEATGINKSNVRITKLG